jgi:DeoR/GlpR family transcriptional regulator of sugar metabolism
MITIADRKVLLVDSTKFDVKKGLYHVADLTAFDDVFVEQDLPAEHRAQIERLNLMIHYVATT